MKLKNELPIYIQIVESLVKMICNGEFHSGDKIPSIRDLAQNYNANPNTCVKALQILEDKKLIVTVSTSGKFVTEQKEIIEKEKKEMKEKLIDEIIKEAKLIQFDLGELATLILKRGGQ